MKKIVLYIETLRRGGAERVMSVLANYFYEKKYDVVLITNTHDDKSINQYEVSEGITRYYLDEMYRKNANSVILRTLWRIKNIRKICKEEDADVVLSFLRNCNIRMLLATLGIRCKKVVSVRNDPKKEYAGIEKMAQLLFCFADGIVFQTYDAMKWFDEKIASKGKVIFNPVDARFYEKQWTPIRNEVVTFGRLVEQKNHALLIRAFSQIHRRIPEVVLKIYGDDFAAHGNSRKDEIVELISSLELKESVFLCGNVENVQDILSESRLFVLSSNYEGMPNALMEAMTVGIPVISTDCPCGGPALLTEKGNCGELIPCGDEGALVDAMQNILMNESYASLISQKEKKRAQEFKKDKVLKDWESYLLKVNGDL